MNDAIIQSSWRHRARVLLGKVSFPAPQRPVVLIQSDDWGRIGVPDRRCFDDLRRAGLNVGQNPWDLYGLETEEDLERLGASLERIRDRDGNPACITANFVMANADLRRMREQGYREFLWKSIDEGFPEPWTDTLAPTYRRLVAAGVFYPGLHGFTHFNATALMASLQDPGPRGEVARRLVENDIPYLASLTPEFNFALADGTSGTERMQSAEAQRRWLQQGIDAFQRMFGFAPVTFCAPGYRGDQVTWRESASLGIRVVQTAGRQIPRMDNGSLIMVRNVANRTRTRRRSGRFGAGSLGAPGGRGRRPHRDLHTFDQLPDAVQ